MFALRILMPAAAILALGPVSMFGKQFIVKNGRPMIEIIIAANLPATQSLRALPAPAFRALAVAF
jgi:hypothetical protein